MIGADLFRRRRMETHVDADVAAGVKDPDAFVMAFRTAPTPQSAYALQKHRRALTTIPQRDELHEDARAVRRSRSVTWTAATRAVVLIVIFGMTEWFTLSLVLIGLGVQGREAYAVALILAALAVLLIEGATRATHRAMRVLSYTALVAMMLCLAWVRSHAFFSGGGSIQQVVAGVIALAAAAGSGVGLHIYRRRAHAVGAELLEVAKLERDSRTLSRGIAVAEKALVKNEIAMQRADAEETSLRTMYERLHAIATARLGGKEGVGSQHT